MNELTVSSFPGVGAGIGQKSWLRGAWATARRNPSGTIAGFICLLLIILALIGPEVAPHAPDNTNFERLESPSLSHPFGTDALFRDVFSRVLYGTRNSLGIGFSAIAISTACSVLLGLSSGYLRGKFDLVVGRLIDVMLAYPALVFIIFLVAVFGSSFFTISLAIGIITIPGATRIVRGATIGVAHQLFIEAAVVVGSSPLRIMFRHILPNVAAPIIVVASTNIGTVILIEAAISFLGLGISTPAQPSWGSMLQESRSVWQQAWWTMMAPGLAISIAVLSFNFFGDALRDALDPRLRGAR